MSGNFGSALFTLQGGKPTASSVYEVLQTLVRNPEAREQALSLGTFVSDMSERDRQQNCVAMAQIMFAKIDPAEVQCGELGHGPLVDYRATPELCAIAPVKFSMWSSYIVSEYDKRGKSTSATIPRQGVVSLLRAIEGLWGLPGYLVKK